MSVFCAALLKKCEKPTSYLLSMSQPFQKEKFEAECPLLQTDVRIMLNRIKPKVEWRIHTVLLDGEKGYACVYLDLRKRTKELY